VPLSPRGKRLQAAFSVSIFRPCSGAFEFAVDFQKNEKQPTAFFGFFRAVAGPGSTAQA
jgi:hypothetical protein